MGVDGRYNDFETGKDKDKARVWSITSEGDRTYSYDEAIDLTGNGWYNVILVMILSVHVLTMCIDMFGFSVLVTLSSCEFQLSQSQKGILVTMPFLGPITMAYAWGYISDTQGRRKSLIVAMGVSFVLAALGAFSPNWITMAVLKFFSTCFCSCAQSATSALLGESCPKRVSNTYLLVLTSIMQISFAMSYVFGYYIMRLDFVYDLGFISWSPWRLTAVVLALPLGLCALSLLLVFESPKFLVNVGKEQEAIEALRKIYVRNGGKTEYPVKKIVLDEIGNIRKDDTKSLWVSIWEQSVPLFKPPFLYKTMLVYYLLFVVYFSSGGLFVWLPFLAKYFDVGLTTGLPGDQGIVTIIKVAQNNSTIDEAVTCTTEFSMAIMMTISSLTLVVLSLLMSTVASHKKTLMITTLAFSGVSALGVTLIPNNIVAIILYFGVVMSSLCIGLSFAYCVEFYPTSFRGMAACLGVMVARMSNVAGVNAIGAYIMTDPTYTFCALAGLMFSGVIVSCFLPPDTPKKCKTSK